MKNLGKISDSRDIITVEYLNERIKSTATRGKISISSSVSTVTLPVNPSEGKVILYLNGILLEESENYTISGSVVSFTGYTLISGDILSYIYIK